MDKGGIAEWGLSQAMEPAQAAGVIGDLLETGAARTDLWFWSNVLQTLAATVWRDVKAQPLFVIGLAARGALVLCILLFFVLEARGVAFGLATSLLSHSRAAEQPKEWLWPVMRIVSLLATLYAGRWIALRSSGKDLAVCVAMSIVFPFVDYGFDALLAWCSSFLAQREFLLPPFWRFWYYWREVGSMAAFLAGVALVRRRRQIPGAA
jgi:hypothetical protein